ncbi:MAG: hypothetical protein ACTSVE_10370, partial [Candidatus Helarchaeota archaeon]
MNNIDKDLKEDKDLEEFPKKIRNYMIKRVIFIYIIVGALGLILGGIFWYNLQKFFPEFPVLTLWTWPFLIGVVIGLNLFFQWWSRFFIIPNFLLKRFKELGFEIRNPKRFKVLRRTRICVPKKRSYFKVGVEVKYFPFFEFRNGYYRIAIISIPLCNKSEALCVKLVQDIAEKNLLGVTTRKEFLHFNTTCSPEEAVGRMMQMTKAIREWENAK